jgi:uncharacterized protein YjbI with pentapeptide repeats
VANKEHVERIKKTVQSWNTWRQKHDLIHPDLSGADLTSSDLSRADLRQVSLRGAKLNKAYMAHVNLRGADLSHADLTESNMSDANLNDANLSNATLIGVQLSEAALLHANLSYADLTRASLSLTNLSSGNLRGAKLNSARLYRANLSGANLGGANLTRAILGETVFGDTDLTSVIGLASCEHYGPSIIDHRTLQKSPSLPVPFLHGIGLPDTLIDYLPALFNRPIRYFSCFISYSSKDDGFATRLHSDLQANGVRCWFAPHDLPIGEKILDGIDAAIKLRDKVLLILSKHSIRSAWVEDEVTAAFEEERQRGQIVLFPVRLDEAVMTTAEAWAAKLRARNIGDFRRWKDHDAYSESFDRVLGDLRPPDKAA